jgi:integrase/recombinase XerD
VTEVERYEPLPAEGGGQPSAEQLVFRWLTDMPSPHTRHGYGLDLGVRMPRPGAKPGSIPRPGQSRAPSWLPFCAALGVDPLAARREHVSLWARGMEQAGLSPASAARKLAAVSSWYAWLIDGEYITDSPVKKTHRPKIDPDVSKTPGLTKDQALTMLAAADQATTPQAARNAAMCALLLYTGARVSEACGATLADLGVDRGHRVLWVTRKGGTRQPLVLPAPVLERIDAHLAERIDLDRRPVRTSDLMATGRDRPLISTANGNPMLPRDVWALMRRLGKAAGLPPELVGRMGAHSMRHSFATLTLDAGGNLRDLQDAMGHKDPRTTRRYDRARGRLDRSPGYLLATYLADGD